MTIEKRVIEEATNLKKYATPEELKKLDFETLNPTDVNKCIYGQMTGDCNSKRALELIQKCCSEGYSGGSDRIVSVECDIPSNRVYTYFWSPIEKFILQNKRNKKVENTVVLVNFLKGKRKTIKFI